MVSAEEQYVTHGFVTGANNNVLTDVGTLGGVVIALLLA